MALYVKTKACNNFIDNTRTAWKFPEFDDFFVRLFPNLDWIQRNTPYSVQIREDTDQKKFKYRQFLVIDGTVSVVFLQYLFIHDNLYWPELTEEQWRRKIQITWDKSNKEKNVQKTEEMKISLPCESWSLCYR